MPVRRTPARRLDVPAWSLREHAKLMSDPETPLDEDKWERWTVTRAAPHRRSYREEALAMLLERNVACSALGLDPDPEVARRACAYLAGRADETADWFLHGVVGWRTGMPADPAELVEWRAEQAAPHRYAAGWWRARLRELDAAHEEV